MTLSYYADEKKSAAFNFVEFLVISFFYPFSQNDSIEDDRTSHILPVSSKSKQNDF